MIVMRLLEGKDYLQDEAAEMANWIGISGECCGTNQGQYFQQLWLERKGGILVAEKEDGEIAGWFAFLNKEMAERLMLPTTRANHDPKRLVGAFMLIKEKYRNMGLGTVFAQELIEVGREWRYHGVETTCRSMGVNIEPTSEDLLEAGYILAEHYPGDAGFVVMEYLWDDQIR